jgi:hypothetical protein
MSLSHQTLSDDAILGSDCESLILLNTSANAIHLTLPSASDVSGRSVKVKKVAGGYPAHLTTQGNIEGLKELVMTDNSTVGVLNDTLGASCELYSDGQQWFIMDHEGMGEVTESSDNLIGYWKFNELSGNIIQDLGPHGNDGVLEYGSAPTFDFSIQGAEGNFGGALEFEKHTDEDGQTLSNGLQRNRVKVTYADPTNDPYPSSAFSVSLWMKYEDYIPKGTRVIFAQNNNVDNNNGGFFLRKEDSSNSHRLRVRLHKSDGGYAPAGLASFDDDFQVGQWYHIVVTYDGTTCYTYIDNVVADSTVLNQPINDNYNLTDTRSFIIGNRAGEDQSCEAFIDEVQYFNRALSADDVSSLNTNRTVQSF